MIDAKEFTEAWGEGVPTLEGQDEHFVGIAERADRLCSVYDIPGEKVLTFTAVTPENRKEFWTTVKEGALAYHGYNKAIAGLVVAEGHKPCVAYDLEAVRTELGNSFDDSDRTMTKAKRLAEYLHQVVSMDRGPRAPWFVTFARLPKNFD